MKTVYVIKYRDLISSGFVTFTWKKREHKKYVEYESYQDAIHTATKFKFKWMAKFVVFILQRDEYIKIYKVVKIKKANN